MRVIAGSAGGRRLVVPPGRQVRPTTDRVRESMFNALASMGVLEGAAVLDGFAGTGALGIEALSRGASHATFVEPDRRAVRALRANLASTGFTDAATIERGPVERALRPAGAGHPGAVDRVHFDLALFDPPYAFEGWHQLLEEVPAALVVCESDRAVEVPQGWDVVRQRRYGGTFVVIAQRLPPASEQA